MTPSQPPTAYQRGVDHLKRNEYQAAVSAFTEAIGLNPNEPKAYSGRALAYRSLEDEARALADEQMVRELGGVKPARSEFTLFLTAEPEIRLRVDQDAFVAFFGAVDGATRNFFAQFPQPQGLELQMACALLPPNQLLLEIVSQPETLSPELLVGLRQRIEAIPRPELRYGPVAFSSRLFVNGGRPDCDVAFGFPFASLMPPGAEGPLDDMLMAVASRVAASPSWWARLKRAFGLGG